MQVSNGDVAQAAESLLDTFEAKATTQRAAQAALLNDWSSADPASARALDKAIQQVKKGRIPDRNGMSESAAAALALLAGAAVQCEEADNRFQRVYAEAVKHTTEKLREVASDERFREAVIWQNRQAVHTGLDPLLRQSGDAARGTKQRQHEELVVSYLQRYCTKNDTIGFFGPVGWAEIVKHQAALSVRPGPQLLASRKVFFEVWCIDALCEAIAADKRMLEWTPPRRAHFIYLSGRVLHQPGRQPIPLGEKEAALIRACEGVECARQIADRLVGLDIGYGSRREVYKQLLKFEQEGVVSWKLEVPVELEPELTLTRLLDGIGNEDVQRQAYAKFGLMQQARQAVSEAAGDAQRLEAALRDLEECFTQLTGNKATRSEGRMYAARTLIYEDCRRDAEVEIGEAVMEEMGKPMSLLLQSAQWMTFEVAKKWRQQLEKAYREMVERTGETQVNAADFWYQLQSLLYREEQEPADEVRKEFQRRWRQILKFEESEQQVTYRYDQLRPAVEEAFASPGPGWPFAKYHSPDVMIAAKDEAALKRGDYRLVLGELHVAINTLTWALFLGQHADPRVLMKHAEDDFPEPHLVPLMPKNYQVASNSGRFQRALVSPNAYRLSLSTSPSNTPLERLLHLGELVVEDRNGIVM
ncbi:MAG TPA: lantibiotic dehydratase, partial [Blastocatellia bacterium]|nr:lantibiotic dehydratase [Blastocatellia bacterium]